MPMDARSPKVMLVDDSWYIQLLVQDLLVSEGYQVITASDAVEAQARYVAERPDVVLMDIVLPELDGFDTCAALKRLDQDAMVVFMSGLQEESSRFQAVRSGGAGFLPKPVDRERLLMVVGAAVRRRAAVAYRLQAAG